jgi:ferric-dicitrate binding protein FerR (iron transport regulator)
MGKEHKEYTWSLIAKKLAGEATPEELKELELLLRNNPGLHYPVQTVADLWEHTSPVDKKQAEEAFNRHLDRMEKLNIPYPPPAEIPESPSRRTTFWRRALAVVPALAVVFGGIWYLTRPAHPQQAQTATVRSIPTKEIVTSAGSRTRITLPDSTRVWVNAGSRIRYERSFGVTSREITLTGEAFFDVAPNAAKPFVIHTSKVDIRVLGTSFDIKSYPSDKTTEATLIRGSIEVSIHSRPNNKIILKPNEKLVVSNDDSLQSPKAPHQIRPESLVVISKPTYEEHSGAVIETSWIDNRLIFQEEPFSELAKQLERKYGVTISFDNPHHEQLQFTGIFQKETIGQALEALKLTAPFNYTIEGEHITIH